jgi:hypothetical protein
VTREQYTFFSFKLRFFPLLFACLRLFNNVICNSGHVKHKRVSTKPDDGVRHCCERASIVLTVLWLDTDVWSLFDIGWASLSKRITQYVQWQPVSTLCPVDLLQNPLWWRRPLLGWYQAWCRQIRPLLYLHPHWRNRHLRFSCSCPLTPDCCRFHWLSHSCNTPKIRKPDGMRSWRGHLLLSFGY